MTDADEIRRDLGARFAAPPQLGRAQMIAFGIGAVSLAIGVLASLLADDLRDFFFSYLVAYVFWVGVSVGCLALVMLQFLSRGAYGVVIRRVAESGTLTLPLMALLFIPVLIGMGYLFLWSHAEAVAGDEVLRSKEPYLNRVFFIARAIAYFAIWIGLAYFINRWSREQDRTGDLRWNERARRLSGPGIVIFGLTVTLAATDWVMSLDPHWYSSIFGILFMGGWGLSALTFVIIVMALLARYEPLRGVLQPAHFHDLGNLLLAFLMLYAYFHISQLIIIWSGNLPEETPWYVRRMTGGWQYIGQALLIFHFAIPFLLLLLRWAKRRASALGALAAALIVTRLIDTFYLVAPEAGSAHGASPVGHFPGLLPALLYLLLPVGIGGLWLAFFFWQLRRMPLLPVGDPFLERVLRQQEEH